MNRFLLPKEEPVSPKRRGRFILEEVSLSTENGKFRFFNHPEIGAIRISLAVDYEIEAGQSEPVTDKWFWMCGENQIWEAMTHPELEIAADDLLDLPMVKASFLRWSEDRSEIVLPKTRNIFEVELARIA